MPCLVQPLDGKSSPKYVCKSGLREGRMQSSEQPGCPDPLSALGIPQTRFVRLQKGLYWSVGELQFMRR